MGNLAKRPEEKKTPVFFAFLGNKRCCSMANSIVAYPDLFLNLSPNCNPNKVESKKFPEQSAFLRTELEQIIRHGRAQRQTKAENSRRVQSNK